MFTDLFSLFSRLLGLGPLEEQPHALAARSKAGLLSGITGQTLLDHFLAACPSMAPEWQRHLEFWAYDENRGHYNDVTIVAEHLIAAYESQRLDEFPAAFELLERCLVEGDPEVQELVVIGLMEDLQEMSARGGYGEQPFRRWLGPRSLTMWHGVAASLAHDESGPEDLDEVADWALRARERGSSA